MSGGQAQPARAARSAGASRPPHALPKAPDLTLAPGCGRACGPGPPRRAVAAGRAVLPGLVTAGERRLKPAARGCQSPLGALKRPAGGPRIRPRATPLRTATRRNMSDRLGELLVAQGVIDAGQVGKALALQKTRKIPFGEAVV